MHIMWISMLRGIVGLRNYMHILDNPVLFFWMVLQKISTPKNGCSRISLKEKYIYMNLYMKRRAGIKEIG